MDQRAWTECHVEAFAFFGGVPARLVPDNLKTGVDKPDLYDPKLNRSYAELAAHYGCLVDPARALKPRDKARVERPMPYVRDSFWRGREFASLEQMQAEAARWSRRSPGGGRAGRWRAPPPPRCSTRPRRTRCGRCRPGRSCWPRGRRRRSARTSTPRSRRSSTRCRGGTSARPPTSGSPPRWCSSSSAGSWSSPIPARPGGSRPTSATTRRRRSRSTCGPRNGAGSRPPAVGPSCEFLIGELLADNALYRLRAAQGVIGLADKHDPARLEAACAKAITAGDPSYRTVRGILAAGAERDQPPAAGRGRRRGRVPARPRVVRERHPPARHDPQRRRHPGDRERSTVMTAVTVTDRSALAAALRTLKLSGMLATLDARLAQAAPGNSATWTSSRSSARTRSPAATACPFSRRIRRARFETEATLEGFDFTASPKLPAAQIRDLAALRWLAAGESVILYGPVGVGKSHIAQALAHLAIRAGAEARFMKTSRVLAHLAGGRADRTWDKRLAELTRPAVLVLDDFGMRELTAPQADDLYELITERAGKSLILTSNRAPADWYPLFPNPVVAESLLDRLINNSHQAFMNGPSYRPNKAPARVVPTGKTNAS